MQRQTPVLTVIGLPHAPILDRAKAISCMAMTRDISLH